MRYLLPTGLVILITVPICSANVVRGQERSADAAKESRAIDTKDAASGQLPDAEPHNSEPRDGVPERWDPIAELQAKAATSNQSDWGHWGPNPDKYSSWTTHSNRLVPIYTFGGNLRQVRQESNPYRSADALEALFGRQPTQTLNPAAEYFDQTQVHELQLDAVQRGKKRIILFVFDGMDWQTTRAAAIAKSEAVAYQDGRGLGLAFQDYQQTESDFGYFVSSPHNNGTNVQVDRQIVINPGGKTPGGYSVEHGGATPWSAEAQADYLIAKSEQPKHAYTDSASSATSMTSGIKTYNNAINVDFSGREVLPLGRELQGRGFAVGAVTSVPIAHATPACAYANNVHRNDYQDITRDMLGLPSVFHPGGLVGLDVLLGAGWGENRDTDGGQGKNFVPGNRYLTQADLGAASVENGGEYIVVQREPGKVGAQAIREATGRAISGRHRLLGFFGVGGGHLPFQTADGGYDPVVSPGSPNPTQAESYSTADVEENPVLAELAEAALDVLHSRSDRWWLMIEAGDVDWANHANNIDNSIGAVLSGELAFSRVTQWIEAHGGWRDTYVIVTADHGHYLQLTRPEVLSGR